MEYCGHKWNRRVPKFDWHPDLSTRDMRPEFEKDWMKTVGCRAHTRHHCGAGGGSSITMTNVQYPRLSSGDTKITLPCPFLFINVESSQYELLQNSTCCTKVMNIYPTLQT